MLVRVDRRPLCRVESCINSNPDTRNPSDRVFHFPRGKGPTRQAVKEWLEFVNDYEELETFLTTGQYHSKLRGHGICQRHFAPHQFVTPDKTRLNRCAVPMFRNPDDASATNLLPPRYKTDSQLTVKSRGEITPSTESNNTGDTSRGNQIRVLKAQIKAILEVDDSKSNWSAQDTQDTVDVTHEEGDTHLYSEYLYTSSEANTHMFEKSDLEEADGMFDDQEINGFVNQDVNGLDDQEVNGLDDQELNMRMKPEFFASEQLIKNTGAPLVTKVFEEPTKGFLPIKDYNKINENSSVSLNYTEDESENPCKNKVKSEITCENNEKTVSSELELLSINWEVLPEEMCRLCALKDEHQKQPIADWVKILKELIPNLVDTNDGLPQYICSQCAEKVYTCIEIKQGFIASYKKLKSEFTAKEEIEPELMSDYSDYCNLEANDLQDNNSKLDESVDNSTFSNNTSNVKFEEVSTNIRPTRKRKNKKVKKYSFICMECEELFTSSKVLKDHMKTEHNTLKCEYCNKCFTDASELQVHVSTHTAETQFKCKCGTQVGSIKLLKEHISNHKPLKYNCSTCYKNFRNFFEMKHHEKGHKKFICDICGKQMKNNAYLRVHKRMHTGEKPFQCELCGVSFSASDRYYIHKYKKHSSEKFPCDICDKILYTENSFERHKLGHETGKQFSCDVCLLDFRYEFSKVLHQRAKCSTCLCVVCNLVFSNIQELIEHRSKEHLIEEVTSAAFAYRSQRSYDCNICSKSFKKPYALKNHIIRKHKKPKKQSSEFSTEKKSIQKKSHKMFNCTKCEKKFKTCKALRLHSASYHEDENYSFSCSYCKEQFEELNSLINHESQHLKEKVFSCCGWIFCSKADFIRHKRLHSQNVSVIPFEDEHYEETTELSIEMPSHVLT